MILHRFANPQTSMKWSPAATFTINRVRQYRKRASNSSGRSYPENGFRNQLQKNLRPEQYSGQEGTIIDKGKGRLTEIRNNPITNGVATFVHHRQHGGHRENAVIDKGSWKVINANEQRNEEKSKVYYNIDEESFESILLDPEGPYSYNFPRQKRAPPPETWDFRHLPEFEQKVIMNPYAAIIGSHIRKCFYHERWFPSDFLVRFIRANDRMTDSTWIVPDFVSADGAKRPGKGRWLKASSEVVQIVAKEGKHKVIDNVAFWRPDMHDHIWKMLVENTTERLQRLFTIVPSRRFPARRDRVLLDVLSEIPFPRNLDQSSVNTAELDDLGDISTSLRFIGKNINKENEEGEESETQRFYINNIKPIDGLQCVFELQLPKHQPKSRGSYGGSNGDISPTSMREVSQESSEPSEYFQQADEPEESKIPPRPFGAIYPVTYRVLNENDEFVKYQTQFVPFYNVYSIWGMKGIARFKGFMKIPSHQNPRLGLVTHQNTKQLAVCLWKLRGFVV
ncbi:18283_t:CDS:2 [Acaulospora morrowiae]|uniref:18283_t:CDS:1 n=1 Tax=Acaulospora morrowiae TaxID=94023 RepID=A0A9N8YTX2_9GLOM|nr:18283_t:CDS:2 [Acaulospora morrowiae]